MKRFLAIFLLAGVAVPLVIALAQDAPDAQEAGESLCQTCHETAGTGNQWAVYTQSAHSRSFASLAGEKAEGVAARAGVDGDPKVSELCLSCHAPIAADRAAGVSCEACHGSGEKYAGVCGESFAKAVPLGLHLSGERQCVNCHVKSKAHPDLDFLFVLDWEDIAHPRPPAKSDEALFSTEGIYRHWEIFTEKDGLPHHMVFGVTPAGDDVWFATEDGVALYRDGEFKTWSVAEGLPHRAVTQIVVDEETGEVWASTMAGIASFDGEKWTAYTQENSGLANNCTFGITLFDDDVWVATFDGISRYNRKTGEWKKYYLDNAPLEEVWIYGTEADHEKVNFAVWGGGLVEYFPAEDRFAAHHDPDGSFEMDLIQNDGVISQMTTSVSRDNGWTFVASYFGMSAYNGRDWIEMDMDNSGLLSNFINFVKARRSEGWFATDRGLSSFDAKRDRFVNYRRLDGPGDFCEITIRSRDGKRSKTFVSGSSFPFNFIWGVGFQGEDIWVVTSNGVARGRY